jgi:hypothetical protein
MITVTKKIYKQNISSKNRVGATYIKQMASPIAISTFTNHKNSLTGHFKKSKIMIMT